MDAPALHCRQREQTVRCGQFNSEQVTGQKTSSWRCCKGTCVTESSLTNQTCSQEARRWCVRSCLRKDDRTHQSRTDKRAVTGVAERADLSPRGKGGGGKKSQDKGKGVKTAKPKERFCCVAFSQSKSEYKNLSAAVKQKFAQRGRTSRSARQRRGGLRVRQETMLRRDRHGESCSRTGCPLPPWR